MKQHDLFVRGQTANAKAREHLRRVGHYEFGLDRVPINTGNQAMADKVVELWDSGNEIEGWALYWNDLYGYIADRLEQNEAQGHCYENSDTHSIDPEKATLKYCVVNNGQ